jgi:3-hydroxyisobutyrate dehydrogenase-like beta-hydroxyacid dehydrogenase
MNVGFIGLGRMGAAMAGSLLRAGHDVTVYNRTSSKAQGLVDRGAHLAENLADACRGHAVITMLADDAAVQAVVFDQGGVLQSMDAGTLHVSMSTIGVALCERIAEAHAAAGHRFVAAPVFGRPDAATLGKLFIIAAGDSDAVGACAPLFAALGQKTVSVSQAHVAASVVKLSGNFLIASVAEALGEALALVRKVDIDPRMYVELLTSSFFPGPVFTTYGGMIANEKYEDAAFTATLGEKDIRLTLEAAEALGVPMPLAKLVRGRLQELIARGGADLDWSAVAKLAADDAGLR